MGSGQGEFQNFFKLADLLADGLLLVSEDGVIVAANPCVQRLFGRSRSELLGRPLAAFVDGGAGLAGAVLRRALRSRAFMPGALAIITVSGERLHCRCDGALYRERGPEQPAVAVLRWARKDDGASQFLVLRERIAQLSRENTARRKAEEALARASARYRVTLESIGDAVIATDADGLITFMNPVAEKLTGWGLGNALGRHLDEIFVIVNEQTRNSVESPVAKVLREGTVVGLANHTLLVRRDGTELPIDDSGAPIRADDDGVIEGVVLVFRDLTDRYALERQLQAKPDRLLEADRRKDEFLSMLAHELRNPLAPLRNGVEIIKRHEVPSTVARVAEVMSRQIGHLARLVDDLLDVSRLSKGKIELRVGRVSVAELVRNAEELGRPICEQHGVKLSIQSPVPEISIDGDLTRLLQVLGNLIANAAKFSTPGGKVTLGAETDGPALEIFVTDEGIGIEPENASRVFDAFFQVDQRMDRSRGGLGVGLTIACSIVHMHGGTIRAQSPGLGRGSTFTVALPLPSERDATRI